MLKKLYLALFFLTCFVGIGFSQATCDLQETARYDTTVPCSQDCLPLRIPVPDIKATTNYQIIEDAYLPYPYQCPSDTALTTLYIDDEYSPVINMPFNFCFYGTTYNQIVVGSNGVVTFDVTNADCENSWQLNAGETIPGTGSDIQCSSSDSYYPRACIMGAYYDINPNASTSGTARRISYYFTGTAPYRKMVIVFNKVPLFQCSNLIASQEIVLYESTGIIDVHIENKPVCTGWNEGLAILGIQNWDRTQAVAAPGKNNTVWSESNKTYRFIPSGAGASLFQSVGLYQGTTLLQNGTVASNAAGQLIATFPNQVCFNTDTAVYRVVTKYASCSSTGTVIDYETKVTLRHSLLLNVVATVAAGDCASGGSSTVTVSEPVGAGYEYSIDGGNTFQSSPVFNTLGGVYVLAARHATRGCYGATVLTVPVIETIRYTADVQNATCYGTATGKILIVTQSGTAPFQFSADSGATYQSSNLLFVSAGTYPIRVMDNNGCFKDTLITVGQPDSISISTQVNAAYCSGTPDGQIRVTATGGTPGYRYSFTNTTAAYQTSNTLFANVGSFTVYVKDNNNCVDSATAITVPLNDTMRLEPLPDTTLCIGSTLIIAPNTNATRFSWSPSAAFSDSTSPRPILGPQDTATFYLQARLGLLCSRTDTFTVNVLKRPIVNAGNDTIICFGTQATFNATAIRGNKFRWSPASNLSSSVVPNPRATGYIPITYVVEVTDPYGCGFKEYDSVRLTVRPKVRAFAGQDTTAILGQPVQLFGCCMDIYKWQPSSIFLNDTARNPLGLFPPGTTQVVMTTTTPEGCEGKDTVLVKGYVGPTYYVPSAFTPNGDGRNDIFRPVPVGITETYYFNVYNRYGQLVYTTKAFLQGWDGRFKGELQPEAAYVWMIKGMGIDGKVVEQKGTVILMK